jgi:hypothetical protein
MERLGETDHPVVAQAGRQLLGTHMPPFDVANSGLRRQPFCFGQHVQIGIDAGCLLEPRREEQRE